MPSLPIETEGLSRQFGRMWALRDVSVRVESGNVVALLGPNGAGKTTLLRLVAGLIDPTEGVTRVLGVGSQELRSSPCGSVASMLEGHEPPPWATIRSLTDLQSSASPNFSHAAAAGMYAARGLSVTSSYGSLSKGQKRWALAAIALASRADVLLLDEPADGLDPSARRELYDAIRDLATDFGSTVLVATHIISDIERVVDDVAILDGGKLILHEPLEALREQVREVELAADFAEWDFGPEVTFIRSQNVSGTALAWVKCSEAGLTGLRERLGPEVPIRTVSLDQLYLVMTEQEAESPDVVATEPVQ